MLGGLAAWHHATSVDAALGGAVAAAVTALAATGGRVLVCVCVCMCV